MATYGVNPGNLIDTGDELRAATNAISQALDNLNTAVNNYRTANTGATGESVESSVTSQGSSVHSLLAALGNLSSTRAAQLGQFITLTGQTEDYASMTAAEFGQQLPGWVPGGSSSGNSA